MGDRTIIKVFLLDGSYKGIQVTASTTVDEVLKMVAQKLELTDSEYFSLYEAENQKETCLEGSRRPAEIMRQWYERDPTGKTFKFVFKRRLFFKNKALSKDPACQNLLYIQAVNDVVTGAYPCTVEEALKLAGIQMYCAYGSTASGEVPKPGFITSKVHQFLPRNLIPMKPSEAWESVIFQQYSAFGATNPTPQEAKVQYLSICTRWPFYGCTFFEVKQVGGRQDSVFLGINFEGIQVLTSPNKTVDAMFPYTDICSWSSSSSQFAIVVGSADQAEDSNVTHTYETTQGKVISDAVQAYIDVLLKELNPADAE